MASKAVRAFCRVSPRPQQRAENTKVKVAVEPDPQTAETRARAPARSAKPAMMDALSQEMDNV